MNLSSVPAFYEPDAEVFAIEKATSLVWTAEVELAEVLRAHPQCAHCAEWLRNECLREYATHVARFLCLARVHLNRKHQSRASVDFLMPKHSAEFVLHDALQRWPPCFSVPARTPRIDSGARKATSEHGLYEQPRSELYEVNIRDAVESEY